MSEQQQNTFLNRTLAALISISVLPLVLSFLFTSLSTARATCSLLNPPTCEKHPGTNCVQEATNVFIGITFNPGQTVCVGQAMTITAQPSVTNGIAAVSDLHQVGIGPDNCPICQRVTNSFISVTPTVVYESNFVSVSDGVNTTSKEGTSLSVDFTPTNSGPGSIQFLRKMETDPHTDCGVTPGVASIGTNFTVVQVTIDKFWSDQFPGQVGNYLPGGSGSANYNYILLGDRSDGQTYLKAQLSITPNDPSITSHVLLRLHFVRGDSRGASTISGDIASLTYDQGSSPNTPIVVVAGYDADGDGELSDQEICKQQTNYFVRIASSTDYTASKVILTAGANSYGLLFPHAQAFLKAFLLDRVPDSATAEPTSVPINEPTHNVGVVFSGTSGPANNNVFAAKSQMTADVLKSPEFNQLVLSILNIKKSEVKQYFNSNPGEKNHDFTWQLPTLISFGSLSPDLHQTFGTATLAVNITATVKQKTLELQKLAIAGNLMDLYDWDFEVGSFDSNAAIVQAGYNTLGSAGHIFRSTVLFDEKSASYSFNFN